MKAIQKNRKNGIALTAVCLTIVALWFTNRTVAPKQADWADVVAEAEAGGYRLIKTNDLWKKYTETDGSLLLVDTRQDWEYRTGHMKGAVNFPMEPTWLSRWRKQGPLQTFLGPDKPRTIVFY